MTNDKIIKLAREAGGADITSHGWTSWVGTQSTEYLERFANLVTAHEQNRCIGIIHGQCGSDNIAQRTVDAIRSQA